MSSNNSLKFLTTPYKIASALDWKKIGGSILTLDIGKDQIGAAVASHPSYGQSIHKLEPIIRKPETKAKSNQQQKTLAPHVVTQLRNIVKNHNVCGFIMAWPVQKEGRCGAPCGRVLHTLDSIVASSSSSIITPSRLFCLWDGEHVTPKEDEWGRCPSFGESTAKTLHVASLEQYNYESSSATAVNVWNDFCRVHWPEIHKEQNNEEELNRFNTDGVTYESIFSNAEWLENYDDTSSYSKVAH